MRTILITLLMLLAAPTAATAAQGDESAGAEAARAAESADREALRRELDEARREVAEAARKLARIQRQLADDHAGVLAEDGSGPVPFSYLRAPGVAGADAAGLDHERLRSVFVRGLRGAGLGRPRLGLLLGGGDDANEIVGVTPGSGAEKAGIEAGDRLLAIDGEPVDAGDSRALRSAMDGFEAGDTVPVEIERDGERTTFEVELSSPAEALRVISHDIKGPPAPDAPRLDREVFVLGDAEHAIPEPPLPPRLPGLGRQSDLVTNHAGLEPYFGTADGVVVLRIDPDNPLKLEDGDVVLRIDDQPVSRPVDVGRALFGRGSGDTLRIDVMRRGERLELEAELSDSSALSSLLVPPRGIDAFFRDAVPAP
jgi:hypothetical protein